MILVDSNVFMYAAGTSHRCKQPSGEFLARVAQDEIDGAVDAEVLQEILHRYRAIRRWADGRRLYDLARTIIPSVLPVSAEILDAARELLDQYGSLSARDALHGAVYFSANAEAFCSYARDFDGIAGLNRVEPDDLL